MTGLWVGRYSSPALTVLDREQSMNSEKSIAMPHPAGHFYSPIVDPEELADQGERLWPAMPVIQGIDFNDEHHRQVLEGYFPRYLGDYDYPESSDVGDAELTFFYTQNSQFSWLDSRALFVLLRAWRPRRVVEVGSGYSSLLIGDVSKRFLDQTCELTCIEPYPRPFLTRPEHGTATLVQKQVQEVPPSYFSELCAGDILFIDSSHVAKTGSDVNYLYFEVLPRLQPGVRVHVHDIFLPHEYPRQWVIDENRSWNEQYLLRALLMDSNRYRVLFGCSYAFFKFPELVLAALAHPNGHAFAGGSFWFEVADKKPHGPDTLTGNLE